MRGYLAEIFNGKLVGLALSVEGKRALQESKLYLILDTEVAGYERLLKIVKESLEGGVDLIQLRDKQGSAKDILEFSRQVQKILRNRIPYIINDRADVAVAAGASGVHLGQEDLPVKIARKIVGKKAIIGISCQTLKKAKQAQEEGADYIGFGSVFKTPTKPLREPMDLKLLGDVVREVRIPVFAIGGIALGNARDVMRYGVKGIAVCRAICCADNVETVTRQFKKILKRQAIDDSKICEGNSPVECQLPKLNVAGSTPVPRL